MSLTRPLFLWLLLLLPLAAALEQGRIRRLLPSLRGVWGEAVALSWKSRRIRAAALRVLAILSATIALCGPVSGLRATRTWTSGLDVAILLDVSRSMNVEESGSTRLERARREARALMDRLPEGRFALCVFKGQEQTLFPLTDDWETIDEFLDSAGSGLLSARGSDIAAGLAGALEALRATSVSARAIVLLSDGEALSGDSAKAAEACRAAGVPVNAIGIGTEEGGAVPELKGTRSRRDRATLRLLCSNSGGIYADEENRASVLALYDSLSGALSRRGGGSTVVKRLDASAPFILLSCFALALSALAGLFSFPGEGRGGGTGKRKKAGLAGKAAGAALLLLLASLSGCERAKATLVAADGVLLASRGEQQRAVERFLSVLPRVAGTDADVVRYDLGLSYSAAGEREAALEVMQRAAASDSEGLAARAWYSIGCFHFMEADYGKAFEAFKECLKREPGSRDAQLNLELSWELMDRNGSATAEESATASRKKGLEGESGEFELIRQAERDRFKSAREAETGADEKDY